MFLVQEQSSNLNKFTPFQISLQLPDIERFRINFAGLSSFLSDNFMIPIRKKFNFVKCLILFHLFLFKSVSVFIFSSYLTSALYVLILTGILLLLTLVDDVPDTVEENDTADGGLEYNI